jgi:hypothetical protein
MQIEQLPVKARSRIARAAGESAGTLEQRSKSVDSPPRGQTHGIRLSNRLEFVPDKP